jgi:hypothetical protein
MANIVIKLDSAIVKTNGKIYKDIKYKIKLYELKLHSYIVILDNDTTPYHLFYIYKNIHIDIQ